MAENHQVYIGIGSNLDAPMTKVTSACDAIKQHPNISLIAQSDWYQSKAVGPGEQPDYVNGAALLLTSLTPESLLDLLQEVEHQHGRERHERWGPRTLDLDILLFGTQIIQSARLSVPHPQIAYRNFVLQPLLDIDPTLSLPDGRLIADILHIIGTQDLKKITP